MPPIPDASLLQLLAERFPRATGFARPLREKLARAIERRDACAALLQRAEQTLASPAWRQASPQQQQEFHENLRLTRQRVAELQGLIRRLSAALAQNERCLNPEN
ncbi:MAG: hypothetical protein NW208_02505 [Bryobacter sp.]|nr:hypothetical protein [Bryobacter sp.]